MNRVRAEDFGKVALLMGGWSAERGVSLQGGAAVAAALRARGVDVMELDVDRSICGVLAEENFDRVFIMLHGRGGEDGTIQGVLETLGISYTGSGVLGSALAMDKVAAKRLWRGMGLPTPEFVLLEDEESLELAGTLGFPLMVKPAREGSSIGMSRVESAAGLRSAWVAARQYDNRIMAERFIPGAEYTVAILGSEALPLIRLETPRDFYDYEAKYQAEDTRYHLPCGLPPEEEQALQELALRAFQALGAEGWGRVDLMVDGEGQPWLIEVNTVPGMTDHSLVPMAARHAGIDFEELVWRILAMTLEVEA
ncbi:MAG TPA: D-alanine--D-alanine ligase [Thiolapillus brandeum]|uniref:D-alanine--D-alanine ligase n=1 Tax=Thiolapillus brandeum TaxID=1076588 RepID=A0A7C5J0U5_9GAMM|nr:D-alanine--D-alanine ligase [Thiolapillus brandeum]